MDNLPIIKITSTHLNDVDIFNKQLKDYPDYEPFQVVNTDSTSSLLLRKTDTPATYKIDVAELEYANNIMEVVALLEDDFEGYNILSIATFNSKSYVYFFKKV